MYNILMKEIRICLFCKKEFLCERAEINRGWGKFCSRKCSMSWLNQNQQMHKTRPESKEIVFCSMCNKELRRKKGYIKKFARFFCNRECQSLFRAGPLKALKQEFRYQTERIKISIMQERGNHCQICRWSEELCDLHHIIPWRKGGLNDKENLILLCPNHHRLADRNKISKDELRQYI